MGEDRSTLGLLSATLTFAMVFLAAKYFGAFPLVDAELTLFLSGRALEIPRGYSSLLTIVPVIFAVVAFELPASVLSGMLAQRLLGSHGKHAVSEEAKAMRSGYHFKSFFVIVFCEEVFARWFFLGLLTKIPFLSGSVAFYILFFLGNAIWSLVHLMNYKDQNDWHPLRVLPQFVAGVFFTYIYVKYGLFATVIAHFMSNSILFAAMKVQRFNRIDVLIILYSAICTGVSYAFIGHPLSDIQPWFSSHPTFALPGWTFWDYASLSIFASSLPNLVLGLLAYDRGSVGDANATKFQHIVIGAVVGGPIVIGLMILMYWFLGLFVSDVSSRVLLFTVLLCFIHESPSMSAVARTFWVALPNTFITICVLQVMGFWAAVGYVFIETLINIPNRILHELDD